MVLKLNCLNEMVLFSTKNICFDLYISIRKLSNFSVQNYFFFGSMKSSSCQYSDSDWNEFFEEEK